MVTGAQGRYLEGHRAERTYARATRRTERRRRALRAILARGGWEPIDGAVALVLEAEATAKAIAKANFGNADADGDWITERSGR